MKMVRHEIDKVSNLSIQIRDMLEDGSRLMEMLCSGEEQILFAGDQKSMLLS